MLSVEGAEYWEKRSPKDGRKDWNDAADWITGYWNSKNHPHRKKILKALREIAFESVLELGCNAGPNLAVIKEKFPHVKLSGMDINQSAVDNAHTYLNVIHGMDADIKCGNIKEHIPFALHDIVLVDAVLMYVEPDAIKKVIKEASGLAKKAVILVEWDGDSFLGDLKGFHWARDYQKLLEEQGLRVEKVKLTKEDWPTKIWYENGYLYIGKR